MPTAPDAPADSAAAESASDRPASDGSAAATSAPSTSAPAPTLDAQRDDWRWQHAQAATSLGDVDALFPGRFDLTALDRSGIAAAIDRYGMRATPYYLGLARRAGPTDPVWTLAVPSPLELVREPSERDDPIGDEEPGLRPHPALTRRYKDRVLLFPTPTCSVHCRHCFRKRLVGKAEYAVSEAELATAVAWIADQPDIHEVILTGGDPLTLSDDKLLALLDTLDRIEHVWSLRLHTRMPVVNPFRLTEALTRRLGALNTPVLVVTHFNHAQEVTPAAGRAVARLKAEGIDTLNQSVLLRGINETPEAHRELVWAMLRIGVRPYALHHADLVPGTSHLRTDVSTGLELMRALRGTLPGHALPRYLLDVPGGHGKVPLEYPWATLTDDGVLRVEAPDGSVHLY
jgi:lysine 2,3-aminomutase